MNIFFFEKNKGAKAPKKRLFNVCHYDDDTSHVDRQIWTRNGAQVINGFLLLLLFDKYFLESINDKRIYYIL